MIYAKDKQGRKLVYEMDGKRGHIGWESRFVTNKIREHRATFEPLDGSRGVYLGSKLPENVKIVEEEWTL